MTRIEGRDVFGDAWEAIVTGLRGAVALVKMPTGGGALDAPSSLRLGAFLLARGLGVDEGQVVARTLVLVAPEAVSDVELEELVRKLRENPPGCSFVLVPHGWKALSEDDARSMLAALLVASRAALIEFRDAISYVPKHFAHKWGHAESADVFERAIGAASDGISEVPR